MSRVERFAPGDDVPVGAQFLCVHAVAESVWEPVAGGYTIDAKTGERTPSDTRRRIVRDVPYAWFLIPDRSWPGAV